MDQYTDNKRFLSKKYAKKIEKETFSLQHEVQSINDAISKLTGKELTLTAFIALEPDLTQDQIALDDFLDAQRQARRVIEIQQLSLTEEELLTQLSESNTPESLKPLVYRLKALRELDDMPAYKKLLSELLKSSAKLGLIDYLETIMLEEGLKEARSLPFHVLGFNEEGRILIWHKGHLLRYPTTRLNKDELGLLVGINEDLADLKETIIESAHQKGIIDESEPLRTGIWKYGNQWLIISGRSAFIYENDNVTQLEGPVYSDKIIAYEKQGWLPPHSAQKPPTSLKETYEKLCTYLSQWEWAEPGMVKYAAAFVMLSPFQQAMRWRPWLYISGATSCGKSAFFESVIELIYGKLVKKVDKATAHSVCQGIGNSSKILLLDEFEKSKKIPEMLELLKLMGRGGNKLSGTPGKTEIIYALHHMPWFASIYLPSTLRADAAQRNRIVRLELKKVKAGKVLHPLSQKDASDLCDSIIFGCLQSWDKIEDGALKIEEQIGSIIEATNGKASSRMVQNFMYASSLINFVEGSSLTIPSWSHEEQTDDGITVIEAILNTKVRSEGEEFLISDLVMKAAGDPIQIILTKEQSQNVLRIHGLSVVKSKEHSKELYLAIRPDIVRKSLLKNDEDFKGLDISAPLERIPEAEHKKTAWGNSSSKKMAIQIPLGIVLPDD